jgi:hypothetical protein
MTGFLFRKHCCSAVLAACAAAIVLLGFAVLPHHAMAVPAASDMAAPALTPVDHSTAGKTCGIGSGNFARTCRPGTYNRCMNAVARRVEGFTAERCARERDACSSCLKDMHACIGRIGHFAGYVTFSTCDTCKTRFSSCLEKRSR